MTPLPSRFIEKYVIDSATGCHVWTAAKNPKGYGRFHFNGRNRLAHCVAWEAENGAVPAGLMVDHTCHRKSCVNIQHMRLATARQNNENRKGTIKRRRSSVHRGVFWFEARGKWRAQVQSKGRRWLKDFDTEAEAAEAAKQKRCEWHTHNDIDRR